LTGKTLIADKMQQEPKETRQNHHRSRNHDMEEKNERMKGLSVEEKTEGIQSNLQIHKREKKTCLLCRRQKGIGSN